jgi:hypothetical protein
MGKRNKNLASQNFCFTLASDFSHAVKSYDMGPLALLPLWRKVCCGRLLPLKIHRLGGVKTRKSWVQSWQAHLPLQHRGNFEKSLMNTIHTFQAWNAHSNQWLNNLLYLFEVSMVILMYWYQNKWLPYEALKVQAQDKHYRRIIEINIKIRIQIFKCCLCCDWQRTFDVWCKKGLEALTFSIHVVHWWNTLCGTGDTVTNLLGSISQWKFITLRVQYTAVKHSRQLF